MQIFSLPGPPRDMQCQGAREEDPGSAFALSSQLRFAFKWPFTSFASTKWLPFANWSVSKMSEVRLEWHFWASECPMPGDGSTQTMAIFRHTWLQKLLASPSWHSLSVKMSFSEVQTVRATVWWRKVQWEWQRVSWIALSRWKRDAQENQRLKVTN